MFISLCQTLGTASFSSSKFPYLSFQGLEISIFYDVSVSFIMLWTMKASVIPMQGQVCFPNLLEFLCFSLGFAVFVSNKGVTWGQEGWQLGNSREGQMTGKGLPGFVGSASLFSLLDLRSFVLFLFFYLHLFCSYILWFPYRFLNVSMWQCYAASRSVFCLCTLLYAVYF